MLHQLLVASLSTVVVRSAVSQRWVTVFKCDGDGKTDDRWPRDFGRKGWDRLNGMTLPEFAGTASKLRICTAGDYDDCVTTKGDNVALRNLRNGSKNLQPQGWDTLTHGLLCDQNCVNNIWEGPEKRLKQLWWGCPASQDEMVFHACNNNGGLHISMDKGHCEWDWETSDKLEMQLLVPASESPTPSPSASPTLPPTREPTTAKPTSQPTTRLPTAVPTKTPTSGPTVEPMHFEEYRALCALSTDSKDACKGLGCRYKNGKKKSKCIAKPGKKTKCWKIQDLDVCARLGCNYHKQRGCLGKPMNLLDN